MDTTVTATLTLDICTPSGKTWCARITGPDTKYGFDREFVRATTWNTSGSGKTGEATYTLTDGVYETHEGRKRLGRRYWTVTDGAITEIDSVAAITMVSAS